MKRPASSPHSPPKYHLPCSSRRASPVRDGWAALALLPLVLTGGLLPLHGQVTLEVVALADSQAAAPLHQLDPAATRGSHFAHRAFTGAGNNTHHLAIWMDGALAVRGARYSDTLPKGHLAPGTDSTFSGFIPDEIFVNAAGRIAFTANTDDNRNFGFWAGLPGSLQLVARHGSPAPGTNGNFSIGYPGNNFGQLKAFNDAGQVAFSAQIEGAPVGTQDGLWAGTPGALQLVARTGSKAPGPGSGITWNYLSDIQLNSAGQVGVFGRVTQAPPADTLLMDGYVLMVGTPGALQVVARAGDPAPDAEPFTFLRLSDEHFMLNSAGQVVYSTDIWSGKFGVIPSSRGIYVGSVAGSELVARTNQPAPGTTDNASFIAFDKPVLNASGELAFTSFVASAAKPVGKGVWTGKPGRLRRAARTDDVAPGTGGQFFGDFLQNDLLISDSGQVAFIARFSPGGGLYGNSATTGLFATDKTGALHLVARIGAAIGGGPALLGLQLTDNPLRPGSNDSKRASFDRDGRLVFHANGSYRNPTTGNDHYQQFIYRATFVEAAPVILPTGQPASVRAVPFGRADFEVTALGSRPASYQWQRDGIDISDATSATLTLYSLTTAESGAYTVIVTNAHGSTTSAPAQLSFPPVLTQQPQDQQANAGTVMKLSAPATGPGTLDYQWQFKATGAPDFTNVSGAAGPTLSLPAIAAGQAGRYRVIVTNSDGGTTSREAVVSVAAAGAPLVKRLFVPGDPVPGISETLAFSTGDNPVINNKGEIAFEGKVGTDPSSTGQGTYFRSTAGEYRFVSWQGFKANLSDSGIMAQVNSRPITTIELGPPTNLQPMARRNETAPDGAGSYSLDGAFAFADRGTTAFRFDTHLGTAAFIGKPGAVSLLGRANGTAPGLAAGVLFEFVLDPVINPSGTAAFFATLKGTGITADNNTGLWKGTAAGVQRIVAETDPVPAAGSGVLVGDIRIPDSDKSPFGWNDAEQVAFSTTLAGMGITGANDKAILAGTPGALAVAAREGVANGHTFDFSQKSYPLINRNGQVAFVATVTPTGTSDFLESVWRWTPGPGGGTRQLIAREGQQAPGLPAGIVLDSAQLGRPLFALALNATGQLVLTTRIAGPGISFDASNDLALYLTNAAGELKFIARTGGMIDLGGGALRELGYITLALQSGGEDGRRRSFTESGEVVFMGALRKTGSFALDYSLFTARLAPDTSAFTASYNAWAATAFPAGSGSGVTGPTANFDKDDMLNAMEWLMATDPLTPGPSALAIQSLQNNGITLTFPRRAGVPEGFEIIETSPDLTSAWTPIGRTAVKRTDNGPNQPQTITIKLLAGETDRFVRVRASAF